MSFDVGIKFSVETSELINARNALQSLAQAAGDLNKNQDKAASKAEALKQAVLDTSTATEKAEKNVTKLNESTNETASSANKVERRLNILKDQVGYLNGTLEQSQTGFTRMQANLMASMKAIGASESQLREFSATFDNLNKIMGLNPFDQSIGGLKALQAQAKELKVIDELTKDFGSLTSQQVRMLARDLEAMRQQNEAMGRALGAGLEEHKRLFVEAAHAVNDSIAVTKQAEKAEKERAAAAVAAAKDAEKAEKERAAVVAATAKANMGVMDQAVAKFREIEAEKARILEANRKLVNDSLMQQWTGGVGQKTPEMNSMAEFYAKEQKLAAENAAKLQQINATAGDAMVQEYYRRQQRIAEIERDRIEKATTGVGNQMADQYYQRQANAAKIAADAVAYLDRESARLVATNDYLARGFMQSSANALFKYKEALEATGASAMEVKQKLYLLEQDLMTKQNLSPFTKMREDMGRMQQDVKHLARAISVQLGDVFISLAGGQNPLMVLIQQGDQIRGALQQAKDAGQDLSKAMQGAFATMFGSFKLVGTVLKDFVVDGFRSVGDAITIVAGKSKEIADIQKKEAEGTITPLRAQRLEYIAITQAKNTLKVASIGLAAVLGGILLTAFVQLSGEQDKMAKALAKTGGYFGATSEEAIALSKSLMDIGVRSSTAAQVIEEMAKSGNLGKESFAGIAQAANDAQKYVGIGVDETVKKFSELIKDPIKTLNEFAAQTGLLSQEQVGAVRSMLEMGDAVGAQKLAIELLQQGYTSMANEAKSGMSELGIATTELTDTTSKLWDEFKNSVVVSAVLKALKTVFDVFAVSAHAAVSVLRDLAITAAFAVDVASGGPRTIGEKWDTYTQALKDNAANHNTWSKMVIEGNKAAESATNGLTEAQKKQNSQNATAAQGLAKFVEATEITAKDQAKVLDKSSYAAKRLAEDVAKATKTMSAEQKQAFVQGSAYAEEAGKALKKYGSEWDKAQDKAKKAPKGPKPAETYKVDRSNELAETKKFYDEQLKQLKDAESKQEAILKQSYDAKMISFGEYYAKQTELTLTSQRAQLAVINESSDKQKAAIQSRMLEHIAAFEKEVRAGGNVVELTNKLDAELANLTRTYGGVTQATDTQTQALQTATDKKFYEFYKELNKNLNESASAFEKFSETVATNAANRQADLELQRKLLGTYGAEAEALKASAGAMRSYSSEIKKQSDLLKKQDELIADMRKGRANLQDSKALEKLDADITKRLEERAEIEQKLNDTTALAKQDAEQAAADAVVSYNLKVFQEARDGISNAIYDAIFEGGSKGGDALKQVLKNMFKNYVINMVINPIMGDIVGSVMSAIGMGKGLPTSSGGIGGAIQSASSLNSLFGTVSQGIFGASAGASTASLFGANAIGMAGGDALGALIAANGQWAGVAAGATSAAEAAVAANLAMEAGAGVALETGTIATAAAEASAAAGTASSNMLAAIPGWGWALAGVALLAGLGDFSGEQRYGGGYQLNGNKEVKYTAGPGGGQINQAAQEQVATDTYKAINSILKSFGSTLEVIDFYAGLETSGKGKGGTFAGGKLSTGTEFGKKWQAGMYSQDLSAEEAVKQFAEQMKIVTVEALKAATDIPQYLQAELAKVDVTKLTGETAGMVLEEVNRMFTTFSTVKAAFEVLNKPMFDTTTAGYALTESFVALFGGLEGFKSATSAYYDNFYTDAEKVANAQKTMSDALAEVGLAVPETREAYRQLVEAQDLTTEAGRANYAVLLKNAGAFAELTPAASQANKQIAGLNKMFAGLGVNTKFAETKFDKATKEMFESLGVSVEEYSNSIASVIEGIITGKTKAEDAGQALADAAVGGITNAIAQGASQAIAAQFVNSIITPVIANIMAGRAALDGIDMNASLANLRNGSEALKIVLNTIGPEIASAMTGAASTVADAASTATTMINNASLFAGVQTPTRVPGTSGGATGGGSTTPSLFAGVQGGGGLTLEPAVMAVSSLVTETLDSNKKVSELLQKLLNPKKEYANSYLELADKLLQKQSEFGLEARKTEIANLKVKLADIQAINAIVNPLIQSIQTGYQPYSYGSSNKSSDFDKLADIIIARGQFDQTTGLIKYGGSGAANFAGIVGANGATAQDVVSNFLESFFAEQNAVGNPQLFFDYLKSFLNVGDVRGDDLVTDDDISAATANLTKLEKELREWYIAQARVIAVEDMTTNAEETAAAKRKTAELKRTGGLEDPVTKLKEQFASKFKAIDEGINKALKEEVTSLTAQKNEAQTFYDKIIKSGMGGLSAEDLAKGKELFGQGFGGEYFGAQGQEDPSITMMKNYISNLGSQITDLTEEQQTYIDNLNEWYEAQAELLSTEMLVDINNQIKELEAEEKGPLTTIKDAIQKYMDDFEELGTLTDEVQAQIDKLSNLQLTKAREELYNQLIPADELKQIQTVKLEEQFADLGKQLPSSAEALRAMIDAARQVGNISLADSLLELIPAFLAIQESADGVGQSVEDITKAFTDAYKSQLGRAPDTEGLKYWINLVESGTMTMEEAMAAFSESATTEKLNNRILELTDSEAYLALMRQNELSLLSPINQELQKQIYLLEDQAKALAFANEIARTRTDADIKLLQAQGNTAAAERLQREQFIAGLTGLTAAQKEAKIAAYDYGVAIDKQVRILNERTGLENRLNQLLGNTALLRAQELAKLDASNRGLQQRIWAIEDADKAVNDALNAVSRAVEAEKKRVSEDADARIAAIKAGMDANKTALDTAQKQVDLLSGIFDSITNAVKSLRGSVDKEQKMLNARAYIDMSLALAKSGAIPDKDKLAEAIDVVTNNETAGYSTLEDFKRAQYIQANKLEELGGILGVQKTTEEKQLDKLNDANKLAEEQIAAIENQRKQQLEALDLQLQKAREQVDIMRGVDISVKSVGDAVSSLTTAVLAATATPAGADAYESTPESDEASGTFGGVRPSIINAAVAAAGSDPAAQALAALQAAYSGGMDARLYDKYVSGAGFTNVLVDVPGYADWLLETGKADEAWLRSAGVPGFATGGMHTGGLRIVGEHGPELEATGPSRIWNAQQTQNLLNNRNTDNSVLVAELQALRSEVSMLRAEARATAMNTSKTARILDDVTQGGDTLKTEVAA